MFLELIKLLQKIEQQYQNPTREELIARHISGYLNHILKTKAIRMESVVDLYENPIKQFYFESKAYDALNANLRSNLKQLAEKFEKSNIAHIFERLYLKKLQNVFRLSNKEKDPEFSEHKDFEIDENREFLKHKDLEIDTKPIKLPHCIYLAMLNQCRTISCIDLEILAHLFTNNRAVSSIKYIHDDLDDKKNYAIQFFHDKSGVENEVKVFSKKTTIPLNELHIFYIYDSYRIKIAGKNIGLFLYAVLNVIEKFNQILSSNLFISKNIQPSIFINIISSYCGFNHKISEKEISKYLKFSDLFRVNLIQAFNNPNGLGFQYEP